MTIRRLGPKSQNWRVPSNFCVQSIGGSYKWREDVQCRLQFLASTNLVNLGAHVFLWESWQTDGHKTVSNPTFPPNPNVIYSKYNYATMTEPWKDLIGASPCWKYGRELGLKNYQPMIMGWGQPPCCPANLAQFLVSLRPYLRHQMKVQRVGFLKCRAANDELDLARHHLYQIRPYSWC